MSTFRSLFRFALVLAVFLLPFGAGAQSYEKLWKQAEEASEKDLPRTALQTVEQIRQKALAEHDDGQLLRATLTARILQAEVAPDSDAVCLQRMETALEAETRPVVRALWHSALAQSYSHAAVYARLDTARASLARRHFVRSLVDMPQLAEARTGDYLPLFDQADGSRLFADDLLHVLLQAALGSNVLPDSCKAAFRDEAEATYRRLGNRTAVLWLSLERLSESPVGVLPSGRVDSLSQYAALVRLASDYADLPENAWTYRALCNLRDCVQNEEGSAAAEANDSLCLHWAREGVARYGKQPAAAALRNVISRLEAPEAKAEGLAEEVYPGSSQPVALRVRGAKRLQVRIYRMWDNAAEERNAQQAGWESLAKSRRKQAAVRKYEFAAEPLWHWSSLTDTLSVPSVPGIYAFEIEANGRVLDTRFFHVTALKPLRFAWASGHSRVTVVDAQSGAVVPHARVTAWKRDREGSFRQARAYDADDAGCVRIDFEKGDNTYSYTVSKDGDAASPFFALPNLRYYGAEETGKRASTQAQLFTDRAIYRPGQEVCFSGVVWASSGDDRATLAGHEALVVLDDANLKTVDSLRVSTDSLGNFFGTFKLPQICLPGRFSLRAKVANASASTGFQVEEYKRPTFTATTAPVREAYALGDTVRLVGEARTYSGVPVAGARVQWTVTRSSWWRIGGSGSSSPQQGECLTDSAGGFVLPVCLVAEESERTARDLGRFFYSVSYTVTAENGETAQGQASLSAATRPAWLESDVPATLCRELLPEFTVRQRNAAGENVETQGTYIIRCGQEEKARGTFLTGKAFSVPGLVDFPSGRYEIIWRTATSGVLPDTSRFVLFSESDTRPADRTSAFFSHIRLSEQSDSAFVLVGSPERDATLFFDVVAGDSLYESRRIVLTDSLIPFRLAYRPEYGGSAKAFFVLVRDGKVYCQQVDIKKPASDKRLLLRWTSFRSRLTPGQQEEWRLQIVHPDGTPARASLMARLYDASLDAFATNPWQFSGLGFYRPYVNATWSGVYLQSASLHLSGAFPVETLVCGLPLFTAWKPSLFSYSTSRYSVNELAVVQSRTELLQSKTVRVRGTKTMNKEVMYAAADAAAPVAEEASAGVGSGQGDGAGSDDVSLRTQFAETAFFQPALRTDGNGVAVLSFTLPESLTEWNFSALAHTAEMDYGSLDTTVVARKDFMVEAALPRFVRVGDRTSLPVTVHNLSAVPVEATLELSLTDALTQKQGYCSRQKIALAAGESRVFTFAYTAPDEAGLWVCRTVASGGTFSDGEERYLPVLSDEVEVTRTLPFTLSRRGVSSFRLDTLWNSDQATHRNLTVELSSNPTWYAVSALPALAGNAASQSASEWATRYYALVLGRYVAEQNPEVRKLVEQSPEEIDELAQLQSEGLTELTPWLQRAQQERQRIAALKQLFDENLSAARQYTALDRLEDLQRADGSWSWYKGMPGNDYITADVAVLLARLQRLTGDEAAASMLKKATEYLRKEVARQVAEMKKAEKKSSVEMRPTELQLRYLYLRSLCGLKPDDDADYLLDRTCRVQKELTMYGKALTAVTLAEAGRTDEARTALQSLMEHTVESAEMGRYFDTPRAEWSWNSYRIPTQCAAIEALAHFGTETEAREEMQLWLLLAKRTQMWETSRASADAVYALLAVPQEGGRIQSLGDTEPLYFTLYDGKRAVALNDRSQTATPTTAGYFKQSFAEDTPSASDTERKETAQVLAADCLQVSKSTDGLAWGSVYATFTVPAAEVKTEGKGLRLTRRLEWKKGTEWVKVEAATVLRKGDRVREVFTLVADRDYDFVALASERPACLEPVRPLSGYHYAAGLSTYRAVGDTGTQCFIEQVHKGTHTFTEEYFVDRAGTFSTGTASVRCVYAPEFGGTAAGTSLCAE